MLPKRILMGSSAQIKGAAKVNRIHEMSVFLLKIIFYSKIMGE
jgi:hypothetical protein